MTSKLKTDVLETVSGSGTIALTNQLSGMTSASVPLLDHTKMPVGSVLQVVQNSNVAGSVQTTSTSLVASGLIATITPKYANSKIVINYSSSMAHSNGVLTAQMFINVGGAGYTAMAGSSSNYMMGYIQASNNYAPMIFNGQYQCTNTNTLNIQPYIKTTSGTANFVHSNSAYALTLTEIKQ
jgi:hypothetical protein